MNNPFNYVPDPSCQEAFGKLLERIDAMKAGGSPEEINFYRELEAGKMLGVLVASDDEGNRHTLYAFSGQLGEGGFHWPGFVGPPFDYLLPEGYFKIKEREISNLNEEIRKFETGPLEALRLACTEKEEELRRELAECKRRCRRSKEARDLRRKAGGLTEEDRAVMVKQSQFEKAELHRLKKRMAAVLAPYSENLRKGEERLLMLKARRRADSEALQQWLFSNFKLLNGRGESKSLSEIFADTPMKIPPSGAGECCAPKLLQAAYKRGLRPWAMAEFWYGRPKDGEVRRHGCHYPACRGKCLPVLSWMLQGLDIEPPLEAVNFGTRLADPEIIFENEWFCVVHKPAGMLSVPGKREEISVQQWLSERYREGRMVKMAHRLDQATSGLLIAAFDEKAYKILQGMFARREIKKTYVAVLEGEFHSHGHPRAGRISLPLAPDWLDRPRQRVDFESGKEAVTEYEFTTVSGGRSRIIFHPLTGRTHQLRVHAASASGLGMPIAGDRLYGSRAGGEAGRLLLHAQSLEFIYPVDGQRYRFEAPAPF